VTLYMKSAKEEWEMVNRKEDGELRKTYPLARNRSDRREKGKRSMEIFLDLKGAKGKQRNGSGRRQAREILYIKKDESECEGNKAKKKSITSTGDPTTSAPGEVIF